MAYTRMPIPSCECKARRVCAPLSVNYRHVLDITPSTACILFRGGRPTVYRCSTGPSGCWVRYQVCDLTQAVMIHCLGIILMIILRIIIRRYWHISIRIDSRDVIKSLGSSLLNHYLSRQYSLILVLQLRALTRDR